jgi:MFS family permease
MTVEQRSEPEATNAKRRGLLTAGSATTFVVLIGTVSLFSDATYEGGRSLIGQFLEVLGSSAAAVGIAVGAGEFLGYALRLVSGYAADRTGAYWRITLIGYSINLLAMPLLAFVGRWQVAIALLFLERIGKAVRNPARDAMLSYATSEMGRGWGFGLHEAMDQIGAFLGPLLVTIVLFARSGDDVGLGGYHQAFAVLFVPALLAITVLLIARFLFPHPRDLESKTPKIGAAGLTRSYWWFAVAAGFLAMGFADFALMAFHFQATDLVTEQLIPILFATGMAVDAAAALIMGRLFDRRPFATLMVAVMLGALFAPFVFLGSLQLVVVGIALWGIGLSTQEVVLKAALSGLVPVERRAYGFGMFATVFGAFWFAGSAAMGFLYDFDPLALVVFSVIAQLVALPLFVVSRRSQPAAFTARPRDPR